MLPSLDSPCPSVPKKTTTTTTNNHQPTTQPPIHPPANRQPPTDNRQQTTDNRQTDNRQQTTDKQSNRQTIKQSNNQTIKQPNNETTKQSKKQTRKQANGDPYRNSGFRRECHTCHLAKGEAFKARSEKREPPAKSTKESARVAALEKEVEPLQQATKKTEESSQQETDAPSKAAYKMAIKAIGQLQTAGLFSDSPTITGDQDAQGRVGPGKGKPLGKRIRAGQHQIAMHGRHLKAANDRVQEVEQSIVAAQRSLEQHRATVEDIEKALQERRNHLEQLHRQVVAEASHGAEATQLEIMFPDGITKHLPQEAKDSLKRAADLCEPTKDLVELNEFGGLHDQDDPTPDPTVEARIRASIDELQAQTRGDPYWRPCWHRWPGTSAHRCPRRNRSRGGTGRRLAAEISIVTIHGNFWTTHAEWMAQVGRDT